jgi:hypothetical protein
MKTVYLFLLALVLFSFSIFSQTNQTDTYKKRVLETAEVDFLMSYYTQDGNNASVTGGIGNEDLIDVTPTILLSVPLNEDDVLTIDAGISAYSSASSSNLNPFDRSGASQSVEGEDDDKISAAPGDVIGSPWVASSGASQSDVWSSISLDYAHSSDDRNTIWNVDASFANEYDYMSIGFGVGITKLFNEKNTTLGLGVKVYLDSWRPQYPTELDSYIEVNGNLFDGFFEDVPILNQDGLEIDKTGITTAVWDPFNYSYIDNKSRNSYALSFSFSQILNKNAQFSIFFDLVKQDGWLANPMQRVYFGDVDNYYIGNAESIPVYTSTSNKDVFQLADDIERLPDTRSKFPIGMAFNYYLNETFTLRTYYRYYFDDWGIKAHTVNLEIPIKITDKFTLYPSYRYYNQTEADYFAPYEQHSFKSEYYTSDYDLSKFNANQYGFGISYTDIFTKGHIWKFGLKNIDLKYNSYKRNTGLKASIISAGFKFIMD